MLNIIVLPMLTPAVFGDLFSQLISQYQAFGYSQVLTKPQQAMTRESQNSWDFPVRLNQRCPRSVMIIIIIP